MPSTFLPGQSVGYNGNTGAQARWDEASGMWIDSNGDKIRDDAIQAKASGATQPGAPAGPTAPGGGGGGVPPALASAAGESTGFGDGLQSLVENAGQGGAPPAMGAMTGRDGLGVREPRGNASALAALAKMLY